MLPAELPVVRRVFDREADKEAPPKRFSSQWQARIRCSVRCCPRCSARLILFVVSVLQRTAEVWQSCLAERGCHARLHVTMESPIESQRGDIAML